MLMDTKIKTQENEIMQACLIDKLRMKRQDIDIHTIALEYCRREFVTLLPWLRLHLTKQSDQGSAPHKEERMAPNITRIIKDYPQTKLEDELKSHTCGATP